MKTNIDFEETIGTLAADPLRFEELLEVWKSKASKIENTKATFQPRSLGAIERAMSVLSERYVDDPSDSGILAQIQNLSYPAFVVRRDGTYVSGNKVGDHALGKSKCSDPDWFPYEIEPSQTLACVVETAFARLRESGSAVSLFKAHDAETEAPVTLAITPTASISGSSTEVAAAFVIQAKWRDDVLEALADIHGLTGAEISVLRGFLEGLDLKSIAKVRGRSLATVRTQFQSILAKTNVSSQSDLMRLTLALSQFSEDIKPISEAALHPYRKHFELLRPGARRVEVVLAGDFEGEKLLFLPDVTQFTFPAPFEAAAQADGICLVSLSRPGHGSTDVPVNGQSYEDCLLDDLTAVLDQLAVDRITLFAKNMSSPIAFRLGGLLGKRIKKIIIASPVLPPKYLTDGEKGGRWTAGLSRALRLNPTLFMMIARAGMSAWRTLGTRRITAIQFRGAAADLEIGSRDDVISEMDKARDAYIGNGPDYAEIDLRHFLWDWSDWVSQCRAPVLLFCGQQDSVNTIDGVRRFVNELGGSIGLREIPDAGFMAYLTHPEAFFSAVLQGSAVAGADR